MNRHSHPILPKSFYLRQDAVAVARDLLGKVLCTMLRGRLTSGIIVETEAYGGPLDRACHAWNNRRTQRTETMYLPGGHAYVYLCYGMHEMFNIVTGPRDYPAAVLIRAIEPLDGIPTMLRRRKMKTLEPKLTAGPGSLSQAMGITRKLDAAPLLAQPIWVEDRGQHITPQHILSSPRVGVAYAGADAALPWRFRIQDNPWTSPAR